MDYKDLQAGIISEHFWFKGKTGLIEVLLQRVKKKSPLSILDVGAGTGNDIDVMHRVGDVYVLDIEQAALDLIPNHLVVDKKLGDACAMPYQDNFFEVVIACDVLEHIQDDAKAVSEIKRVLKPEGFFIFTVPAFNFLYSKSHDAYLGHFRRYNKRMLHALLASFDQCELGYWNFFLFAPAAIQRLLSKENANNKSLFMPAHVVNTACCKILAVENWLIAHKASLPIGLSLYGIYQKRVH